MIRYIIKRILMTMLVIVIAAIVIFALMNILPGDPASSLLGDGATYEEIQAKKEAMGLSGPFIVRLGRYLYNFFIRLDFGRSWFYNTSVYGDVAERIPRTIGISLANLFFTVALGVPVGVMAAMKRGKWQDKGVLALAMIGMAVPGFWVQMELIILFSLKLHWLPASGIGSWKHYILPIMGGILGGWTGAARQTRQSVLEVMRADYIATARAKGVPNRKVIIHHMLPNALMPVITMVGGQLGGIIGGSLATERTFSIPGVGTYMLNGVSNRDYPIVEAVTILLAAVHAISMLLVDLAYGFVDPRIKAQYVSQSGKGRRKKKNA